jgi:hypothetical protein
MFSIHVSFKTRAAAGAGWGLLPPEAFKLRKITQATLWKTRIWTWPESFFPGQEVRKQGAEINTEGADKPVRKGYESRILAGLPPILKAGAGGSLT